MAFRKLFPIVIAAILWGKYWSAKRIKFYCANLGTVQIIRKGRSKVNYINQLMRRLTWCSVKYNICLYAEHLPGKSNVIADALSRFQMQHFRRLVPHADKQPLQCPPLSRVMWKFEEEFAPWWSNPLLSLRNRFITAALILIVNSYYCAILRGILQCHLYLCYSIYK